jgi:uncharacterized protein
MKLKDSPIYSIRLIEKDGRKFALSGSSARKLRQGVVNLLAGRATRQLVFPLLPSEMANDFVGWGTPD